LGLDYPLVVFFFFLFRRMRGISPHVTMADKTDHAQIK